MPLIGENTTRVERGQYYPNLAGSGSNVAKTITLSNSGKSLDRMALRWSMGGWYWYTGTSAGKTGFNLFGSSGGLEYGVLLRAYLSAVNTITLTIYEIQYFSGTSANGFIYEVERW